MKTNKEIIIAVAIDQGYLMQLCVMLHSLFDNNKTEVFKIFVLSGTLGRNDELEIEKVGLCYSQTVKFIKFDTSILDKYHISQHISHATYYRILIPELFPVDIKKVLYLDSDIIINSNLSELWEINIENKAIAAAPGPFFNAEKTLGLPKDTQYFNAGILLMNLDFWRKNNIHTKVLTYLDQHSGSLPNWDQDALNAILYRDVKIVDISWNIQTLMFLKKKEYQQQDKTHKQFMEHPKIVHYTGVSKPWHYADAHPYKFLFTKYLKLSGIDYKYPDKSALSLIKRWAVKLLPWSWFEKYISWKK